MTCHAARMSSTAPGVLAPGRPAAGSGLRARAARGTLVNGAFLLGVNTLALLRGFLVAAFLTRADYGVWGVVLVILATLQFLKAVGIGDRYVQQDEPDQELAFRRALTLELALAGVVGLAGLGLVPLLALLFDTPQVVAPALVALLVLPAQSLQAPLWIFYREMDFVRQRKLQVLDPVSGFVIAVVLLLLGADYWALIVGVVGGSWLGAIVALRACPYSLRPAFDRQTLRNYAAFSWPLFLAGTTVIVVGQGLVLVAEPELGLAGVGVIALTATVSQYANRADEVVTQTIYPTICAVKDRADLLYEAFVKSNRLALMWGAPFGFGLALFASDLVSFGIGERWRPAVGLMQAVGAAVAIRQIGFNWDAFYRARGQTRPIGMAAGVAIVVFIGVVVPLLYYDGLAGLALGTLVMEGVALLVRAYYLRRLFASFAVVRHAARALLPSVPAVAVVLGLRALAGYEDSLLAALGVLALYVMVTALATALIERRLVREILDYLRRGAGATAEPAAS